MTRLQSFILIALSAVVITACTSYPAVSPELSKMTMDQYYLDTGDIVHMTVYDEADLAGDYPVDGNGAVTLPLIGAVTVRDLSVPDAQTAITNSYAADYLKDPKITLHISEHRPFFILGEVKNPGAYPYQDNINVLNAVALGGGFTYRANRYDVVIRREFDNTPPKNYQASIDTTIFPGDVIEVKERLF